MRLCLALVPVLLLALPHAAVCGKKSKRPNILFIMSDDLGWGDVGWSKDASVPTPELDKLRKKSLELMYFYSQPKCTPARAALLTGRYPYRMGLQTNKVFTIRLNNTLDYKYKLLPEYLKDIGYRTHMVGKWHLGHCNVNATPIKRGFETHYGSFTNLDSRYKLTTAGGRLDWNWNNKPDFQAQGNYTVNLLTNHTQWLLNNHFKNKATKRSPIFLYLPYLVPHSPVEAPERYITNTTCNLIPKFAIIEGKNVSNWKRRTFCGMVAAMDEGVGNITKTLKDLGVLKKFIIIFTSDNGGAVESGASNWPLRGNKQTIYEGGTRVRTLLHAPKYLRKKNRKGKYYGLIHITDVLPTLLEAAGGNLSVLPKDIDGMSAWQAIRKGKDTNRQWMVYNIDSERELGAIRFKNGSHDYKLIFSNGSLGETGYRYQDPRSPKKQEKDPREHRYNRHGVAYFMYNLATNPDERPPLENNTKFPDAAKANVPMFNALKAKLEELTELEVPRPYYTKIVHSREENKKPYWGTTGC